MRFFIELLLITIAFVLGLYIAWCPIGFERLYSEFNWYEMYEDGSYQAETTDGVWVQGCIKGAMCND